MHARSELSEFLTEMLSHRTTDLCTPQQRIHWGPGAKLLGGPHYAQPSKLPLPHLLLFEGYEPRTLTYEQTFFIRSNAALISVSRNRFYSVEMKVFIHYLLPLSCS